MKLIIDIPEEIVTAIQNGQDYRYDIHTVIAQGKPYDTSGDLISREALKKAIMFKDNANAETWEQLYDSVLEEIDNAPTVNTFTTRDLEDAYIRGKKSKIPQGEWITTYKSRSFCNPGKACSLCGKVVEFSENYCPKCGTRMETKT